MSFLEPFEYINFRSLRVFYHFKYTVPLINFLYRTLWEKKCLLVSSLLTVLLRLRGCTEHSPSSSSVFYVGQTILIQSHSFLYFTAIYKTRFCLFREMKKSGLAGIKGTVASTTSALPKVPVPYLTQNVKK